MKNTIKRTLILLLGIIFLPNISGANTVKAEQIPSNAKLQLDSLLKHEPHLKGAIAGVSVRSAKTGKLIYEHLGNTRLIPASNLKLLTAGAALSTLGEDYIFTTDVLKDGSIKGNRLYGNLYIKGQGDPTLLQEDFEEMAKEIRKKGIKVVTGNLIGDDTWFDDVRYSIDLPWSDEHMYYGAQVSALTVSPDHDFDTGTVKLTINPAIINKMKTKITISPNNDYVKIINKSKTISSDGVKKIKINREHGGNTITITGEIPLNSPPTKEWIAVWNPTGYVLDLFEQALTHNGIKIMGEKLEDKTPKSASILISHCSIPLSELLVPFMKLSNNGHAEMLVKEMGKRIYKKGSWANGIKVLKSELKKWGVKTDTMVIRDGSGISHLNLVPPNEITQLLYSVQKEKWFHVFKNSLPVNGQSKKMISGTLRNRMNTEQLKGRIRAKTGTLTTVSSLSGYMETKSGETIIFSIILNNLQDESKGKIIEDKISSYLSNSTF